MQNENQVERKLSLSSVISEDTVSEQVRILAQRISKIHGPVRITKESSGIQIYFPSPFLIEEEGHKEVNRSYPHGCLNAEKFLGIGRYANTSFTGYSRAHNSAVCLKTGRPIDVGLLLEMSPIEERLQSEVKRKIIDASDDDDKILVDDGRGNKVPRGPGKCISILDLPEDHPCVEFLHMRGFAGTKLEDLARQFNCSYCEEEAPESEDTGTYYRKLAGGFKDTPQGRLIFDITVRGVYRGYQARILNRVRADGMREFWHPYLQTWKVMDAKDPVTGKWTLLPDIENSYFQWDFSPYKTGKGTKRNQVLMGFDAALAWNAERGMDLHRAMVLVEGPLDAGMFGPPACPALGKTLSEAQAALIGKAFDQVFVIPDQDEDESKGNKKGSMLWETAQKFLSPYLKPELVKLPKNCKDYGGLTEQAARAFRDVKFERKVRR